MVLIITSRKTFSVASRKVDVAANWRAKSLRFQPAVTSRQARSATEAPRRPSERQTNADIFQNAAEPQRYRTERKNRRGCRDALHALSVAYPALASHITQRFSVREVDRCVMGFQQKERPVATTQRHPPHITGAEFNRATRSRRRGAVCLRSRDSSCPWAKLNQRLVGPRELVAEAEVEAGSGWPESAGQ